MTLEQLLELGLSEDIAKKIIEAHQAAIKNNYVPLTRFNGVNEEKKQYKEQAEKDAVELTKSYENLAEARKNYTNVVREHNEAEGGTSII